jgi:hypothetical protein
VERDGGKLIQENTGVSRDALLDSVRLLMKQGFSNIVAITGVDPKENTELIFHLGDEREVSFSYSVSLPKEDPVIDDIPSLKPCDRVRGDGYNYPGRPRGGVASSQTTRTGRCRGGGRPVPSRVLATGRLSGRPRAWGGLDTERSHRCRKHYALQNGPRRHLSEQVRSGTGVPRRSCQRRTRVQGERPREIRGLL